MRLFERRLGAVDHRLDALHIGLDLPADEREQNVALLYRGAVTEMNRRNRGIDPRLDGDAGDRGDAAERLDAHRHRFALGGGDFHRHHADLDLRACRTVGGPESADQQNNANQGERRHPK